MSEDSHFVLYYAGPHPPPDNHRSRIRAIPGLRVLDEASPKLMLVDAPKEPLQKVLSELDGWTFEREQPLRTGVDDSKR